MSRPELQIFILSPKPGSRKPDGPEIVAAFEQAARIGRLEAHQADPLRITLRNPRTLSEFSLVRDPDSKFQAPAGFQSTGYAVHVPLLAPFFVADEAVRAFETLAALKVAFYSTVTTARLFPFAGRFDKDSFISLWRASQKKAYKAFRTGSDWYREVPQESLETWWRYTEERSELEALYIPKGHQVPVMDFREKAGEPVKLVASVSGQKATIIPKVDFVFVDAESRQLFGAGRRRRLGFLPLGALLDAVGNALEWIPFPIPHYAHTGDELPGPIRKAFLTLPLVSPDGYAEIPPNRLIEAPESAPKKKAARERPEPVRTAAAKE